jgi:hypothetical protein
MKTLWSKLLMRLKRRMCHHDFECVSLSPWFRCRKCGKEEGLL